MFAGEVSEGATPILFHNKLLPCVNAFFGEAEEKNWRDGCRDGRYHPKYWGVDWGFRQWLDYEVNRKKEGKSIEDEVKAQMYAEGFNVLNDSNIGPDDEAAKAAAVVKSAKTAAVVESATALPSSSATASSSNPSLPQKSEAADVSPVKAQITPEEYTAKALAAARTLGAKEHKDHQAQVWAKAYGLARDNWLPVPLTHISLYGLQRGNSQSEVPALILTDPCGRLFELVERPDRPRRETKEDAKKRQEMQKKLYYKFERWDLYCKRKEEYFDGRGDLRDKASEMMRLFRIEETNADNARRWWAREQKLRDERWKPCPGAFAKEAMETRYRQLFDRSVERKRSEALREEQTKRLETAKKNTILFIGRLAELLARGMIVEGGNGILRARKGITFSDRIERMLRYQPMCVDLRNLASGQHEQLTAAGLRNIALKRTKDTLAAGSKRNAPAKRLDEEK